MLEFILLHVIMSGPEIEIIGITKKKLSHVHRGGDTKAFIVDLLRRLKTWDVSKCWLVNGMVSAEVSTLFVKQMQLFRPQGR